MRARTINFACFALLSTAGVGQTLHSKPPENTSPQSIPSIPLTFAEDPDAPRIHAAQILYGPIECSPDGDLFLRTASPLNPQKSFLSSIGTHDHDAVAVDYNLDAVPDLHDANLKAYFAGESEVVMLVNALRGEALSASRRTVVVPSTGTRIEQSTKSGPRADYLVTFDRHGNYKGSSELDLAFAPARIAAFPSGELLLIGAAADHKTRFALANPDGSLLRILDIDASLRGSENILPASASHSPASQPNIGLARIVPFRDKLLFAWSGGRWIVEMNAAGALRRVAITLPDRQVIDHLIASQSAWYIAPATTSSGTSQFYDEATFYEVNPETGALVRSFNTSPASVSGIACEHEGVFQELVYNDKGFRVLKAKP